MALYSAAVIFLNLCSCGQVVWVREGKALMCLGPDHPVRVKVWAAVRSTSFESFVLGLILANCVLLALDNPGVKDGSILRLVRGHVECEARLPTGVERCPHAVLITCGRCWTRRTLCLQRCLPLRWS